MILYNRCISRHRNYTSIVSSKERTSARVYAQERACSKISFVAFFPLPVLRKENWRQRPRPPEESTEREGGSLAPDLPDCRCVHTIPLLFNILKTFENFF